jgi:hypothetical protein
MEEEAHLLWGAGDSYRASTTLAKLQCSRESETPLKRNIIQRIRMSQHRQANYTSRDPYSETIYEGDTAHQP